MNESSPDELISAYFDGEVTPGEREQVERLLESSIEYRQLLDDTSKLSALLHSFPREAAPADLASNVQRRIETAGPITRVSAPGKRRSLRREWTAFGLGVLATAASVFVAVGIPFYRQAAGPDGLGHVGAGALRQNPAGLSRDQRLIAGRQHRPASEANAWNVQYDASGDVAFNEAPVTGSAGEVQVGGGGTKLVSTSNNPMPANSNGLAAEGLQVQYQPEPALGLFVPPSKEDLFRTLKMGQMVVGQLVDSDNSVMVVELTVVDIDKGAEGMQLLLQKRDVRQVEEDDARDLLGKVEGHDAKPAQATKKSTNPDDLIVLYVRASGEQLAETLESVQRRPDIYRGLETQLPFELLPEESNDSTTVASKDVKTKLETPSAEAFEVPETPKKQRRVAEEADFVVESYAKLNGMSVENPRSSPEDLKRLKEQYQSLAIVGKGAAEPSAAVANADAVNDSPAGSDLDKRAGKTDKAKQVDQSPRGYAAYRVAGGNQRQQGGRALAAPFQNSSPGNQFGSNLRQKTVRSNSDQRDARLMRMLIILKSEQMANQP